MFLEKLGCASGTGSRNPAENNDGIRELSWWESPLNREQLGRENKSRGDDDRAAG